MIPRTMYVTRPEYAAHFFVQRIIILRESIDIREVRLIKECRTLRHQGQQSLSILIITVIRTVGLFHRIEMNRIKSFISIGQNCFMPIFLFRIKRTSDIQYINPKTIDDRHIRLCQLLYNIIDLYRKISSSDSL